MVATAYSSRITGYSPGSRSTASVLRAALSAASSPDRRADRARERRGRSPARSPTPPSPSIITVSSLAWVTDVRVPHPARVGDRQGRRLGREGAARFEMRRIAGGDHGPRAGRAQLRVGARGRCDVAERGVGGRWHRGGQRRALSGSAWPARGWPRHARPTSRRPSSSSRLVVATPVRASCTSANAQRGVALRHVLVDAGVREAGQGRVARGEDRLRLGIRREREGIESATTRGPCGIPAARLYHRPTPTCDAAEARRGGAVADADASASAHPCRSWGRPTAVHSDGPQIASQLPQKLRRDAGVGRVLDHLGAAARP